MLADSFFFNVNIVLCWPDTMKCQDGAQVTRYIVKLMYNVSYCKYLVYEKELISQQQWPVSLVRDTF